MTRATNGGSGPLKRKSVRALWALSGVIAFTAMSMALPGAPVSHAATTGSAMTVTKTFVDGAGKSRTVNLTVSQTANLAPRQTLALSWSGAAPSDNYSFVQNPNLSNPVEYPMVLMQCWGSDNGKSDGTGLDPTHCETSDVLNLTTKAMQTETNTPDNPNPPASDLYSFGLFQPRLKFQAVNGTWYNMVRGTPGAATTSVPLELLPGGLPLNARGEWSDPTGARSNVSFEARSLDQYPATGCSDTQACTLVAVPITDPVCVKPIPSGDACGSGPLAQPTVNGVKAPGPNNLPIASTNAYLRSSDWWLQTNWRNRLSVPLSFLKDNACSVTDTRQAVQIPGSQVASTVMSYYWDPNFCLDPTKFKLQYVQQSEPSARQFLTTSGPDGYENNAILTTLPVTNSPRPVVHAPVLDTGFAISYLIDNGSSQQVTNLNLTPLLLAKLITQSYRSDSGEAALSGNPTTIFKDPEFLAVNPGFTLPTGETLDRSDGTNLILPYPTQTDTIWALTSYINSDPEARAFLDGTPDAYSGMVVNLAYRGYSLPQLATDIRDSSPDPAAYTHPASTSGGVDYGTDYQCTKNSIPPYFNLISQGVPGLDQGVTSMLNLQNPAQDLCGEVPGQAGYGIFAKPAQQIIGNRALLALTSTAQAAEYLLPTAQLQVHDVNGTRLWAGPTTTSMTAALAYTVEDQATGVLSLDFPHLSSNSYPGTMPVYAAIPTAGLDKGTAGDYAQFLRFAATTGQTPGTGVGDLPPGYAPLPSVLTQYTLQAANHVAAQDGVVPTPPADLPQQIANEVGATGGGTGGTGTGTGGGGNSPSTPATTTGSAHASTPGGSTPRVANVAETRGTDSWLAAWGLPMLLGLGVLSGIGAPFVRVAAQPGHPVRTFFGSNAGRLVRLVRRR